MPRNYDIAQARIYGSASVGVYLVANDEYVLIPKDSPDKVEKVVEEVLKAKAIRATVANSPLLGVFIVMNNHGLLLPSVVREDEVEAIRRVLGDLNIGIIPTKYTALANLILYNNRRALASSIIEREYLKMIGDVMGVEVEVKDLRGLYVNGALAVANDNGVLASPELGDEDIEFLKGFFNIKVNVGTVNRGISIVRSGLVANNKGAIVGELTTGFEMMRITETLG